jgi:hypothetical protein
MAQQEPTLTEEDEVKRQEWLTVGVTNNWISDVFCCTHDGGPLTEYQDEEFSEGHDPCNFHIKLLGSD